MLLASGHPSYLVLLRPPDILTMLLSWRCSSKNPSALDTSLCTLIFGGLIVGLAIVDIVRVHKGYADRLDEEERSLLALLCADEAARIGSCFLQIQAVAALTEPVYPIISGTKNYANSASFVMTNSSVGKCLDSGTHDGRTARQVVAGWQAMLEYRACDFDSLSDCGPCVAIVQPAAPSQIQHA